jgi:hypothetical protein
MRGGRVEGGDDVGVQLEGHAGGTMHHSYCPHFFGQLHVPYAPHTPLEACVYVPLCISTSCALAAYITYQECNVVRGVDPPRGWLVHILNSKLHSNAASVGSFSTGCSRVVLASKWGGDLHSICPVLTPDMLPAS